MLKKHQKKTFFILFGILFFVIVDLLSKYLFYNKNYLSYLNIFHASCNYGISFSIHVPQIFIVIITIIALGIIIYFYNKKKINGLFFIFIIAGTIGNLIDRIFLSCVRDFIVFGPLFIFNFADIFLNIGMIGLIWEEFFKKR